MRLKLFLLKTVLVFLNAAAVVRFMAEMMKIPGLQGGHNDGIASRDARFVGALFCLMTLAAASVALCLLFRRKSSFVKNAPELLQVLKAIVAVGNGTTLLLFLYAFVKLASLGHTDHDCLLFAVQSLANFILALNFRIESGVGAGEGPQEDKMDPKRAAAIVPGLLWALSPADKSVIEGMAQGNPLNTVVATTKDSANGIFWLSLSELGLALERPVFDNTTPAEVQGHLEKIQSRAFTPTEAGWALLAASIKNSHADIVTAGTVITPQAIRMLEIYAEDSSTEAQNKLGALYLLGHGVEKDFSEALRWYQMAAALGDAAAQNNIGMLHASGQGIEQDYTAALRWFGLAERNGNTGALDNLGNMYALGLGVTQDLNEAIQWYRKAAARGHAGAMCSLGKMYASGHGVPQDYTEAMFWYGKAANGGSAAAKCYVAELYMHGQGVPENDVQAFLWFSLGAADGMDVSQQLIQLVNRMTPSQLDEAHRLYAEWKPAH